MSYQELTPRGTRERSSLWYLGAAALAAAASIGMYYIVKKVKEKAGPTVIQVQTKPLDHIVDTILLDNLYLLSQEAFNKALNNGKASNKVAATLYSLYK